MRWLVSVAALLALILLAVVVIGWLLPRDHLAAMKARIPAPPAAVWATLTDVSAYPTWRRDVERVELLGPTLLGTSPIGGSPPGAVAWREISGRDTVDYRVQSAEPPQKFTARIVTPDLPYGGAWEYTITPAGESASDVTITERGVVYNPLFRFASRYVFGHTRTIDTYLRALGRRFGAEVVPDSVDTIKEVTDGL